MRPANVITAATDVLAGSAIAGHFLFFSDPSFLLVISTMCLYGGGVVMNDVWDAGLDKVERPERPIPSGLISPLQASLFGSTLLVVGIYVAICVSGESGLIAGAIAVGALVYDKWSKHHRFWGPLNMGLCRGLNLLLGMSVAMPSLKVFGWLMLFPLLYIAAITTISRGEVHGNNRNNLITGFFLYLIVVLSISVFSYRQQKLWYTLPFLLLFGGLIFPPLIKAIEEPVGKNIGKAVKAGVLALIVMNAAWTATFSFWGYGLLVLALLPVSLLLARLFAVT